MALTDLQLAEPLVAAMVTLLEANLNGVIAELNATITDGYTVQPVAQVLPFVPTPSVIQGGLPAVGVQEMPAEFEDDTQFSMNALHEYAVVVTIQNPDQLALALQLRRTIQAVATTIQRDRLQGNALGEGGIMRDQGGALSVNFRGTVPGPLLADLDPINPDGPPRSYLSWTGLVLTSLRVEIGE